MMRKYDDVRLSSDEARIPRDERAMLLMDRLFDGRARKVADVKNAFKEAGIPGWDEYLKEYGIHVTRKEISGSLWAYKNDIQKQRVELDEKAGQIVDSVLADHDFVWEAIPLNAFDKYLIYSRRISDYLKYAGVYICAGDDSGWDRHRYMYPNRRGLLVSGFSELRLDDRNWLLGWNGQIAWMLEEQDMSIDCVDGELLWELYGFIINHRVRKNEFLRCCELVEMYGSLETRDIFKKAI